MIRAAWPVGTVTSIFSLASIGLVNAVAPFAAFGEAARVFIDDDDLVGALVAGLDDVLPVEVEIAMRP